MKQEGKSTEHFLAAESSRREYSLEAIREYEKFFLKLVDMLKREIDDGVYSLLVSDDIGGRIPSLALHRVMELRRGRAPKLVFIPGFSFSKQPKKPYKKPSPEFLEEARDYLDKLDASRRRTLLVSEYAGSAETVKGLLRFLEENKVIADLAVPVSRLSWAKLFKAVNEHSQDHRHNVVVAFDGNEDIPQLDLMSAELAGVLRKVTGEGLTGLEKKTSLSGKERAVIQQQINKTREDAFLLAERAVEKVWGS
ncbi:MAG: hypothetical protein A2939_02640 [Parcubacteria group bacterium RIFCSPLOWO2_01_FULL_48_18]|nr:MAG: hypothetical protein A2939_02640 [Parcubacteria group bacterium RIFCSPLOWO2_01_FULL_48_18]OHB22986.1 MAG: hypothetical protein A3J67_03780 [Parcubacteria group bacterium RIFCSPHIGHO2_02_FULL_48_10b]